VTGAVVSYSVSPALPAGLSLNTTNGTITGTPTIATATSTYTVTATNLGGSTTFDIVLAVVAPTVPGAICGNGLVETGETCDDGNLINGDGCSSVCQIELPVSVVSGGGGGVTGVNVPPLISIEKLPNPLALPSGPGLVTYTYTVLSIGPRALHNVTVTDNQCAPVHLVSGDSNGNGYLEPGETWIYSCQATVNKTTTNIATATGYSDGLTATDTAPATVVVGASLVPPLIHVLKVPDPVVLPAGGGLVTYHYIVTNLSSVPLGQVTLADHQCAAMSARSGDKNNNNLLDTNEIWAYTCQTKVSSTITSEVTASGSANGLTATDQAQATVAVAVSAIIPKLPDTGIGPVNNFSWPIFLTVAGAVMSWLYILYAQNNH
jgi:cysteine-rich repeat protein